MWLELLLRFPTVNKLYLCKEFAPRVMPAVQEFVGVRTTEVLPTLQNIFLEELQSSEPLVFWLHFDSLYVYLTACHVIG